MRYFIILSYDGTHYHGWQRQPNAVSIQETIDDALHKILPQSSPIVGAGRTDTGVHAEVMMCHFDHPTAIDCRQAAFRLNRILPRYIAIDSVRRVKNDAHARFSAIARTYHYYVYEGKRPFMRHYATRLTYSPDFDLMNEAAAFLLTVKDFTSFSKLHTDTKTNICDVRTAKWQQLPDGRWRFEITADRFLRNMVRAVVGTLLDVGRGKITFETFKTIVAKGSRQAAGESVPANALFLVDVQYPNDIWEEDEAKAP